MDAAIISGASRLLPGEHDRRDWLPVGDRGDASGGAR
jgi:hypothetical protein